MDLARQAFRKGDYAEAQRQCEAALGLLPGDANLYEFGALCQFAQGKYKDAAATLYEVLAVRPGWNWDTLSSFYPSARTYTTQLRALERYTKADPGDAAGHFVLAYHYRALDEREAAVEQLREVIALQPRDQVAPGLLKALEKGGVGGPAAGRPAPGR
jgi:tetratricopeptide (TPR) repeat protein